MFHLQVIQPWGIIVASVAMPPCQHNPLAPSPTVSPIEKSALYMILYCTSCKKTEIYREHLSSANGHRHVRHPSPTKEVSDSESDESDSDTNSSNDSDDSDDDGTAAVESHINEIHAKLQAFRLKEAEKDAQRAATRLQRREITTSTPQEFHVQAQQNLPVSPSPSRNISSPTGARAHPNAEQNLPVSPSPSPNISNPTGAKAHPNAAVPCARAHGAKQPPRPNGRAVGPKPYDNRPAQLEPQPSCPVQPQTQHAVAHVKVSPRPKAQATTRVPPGIGSLEESEKVLTMKFNVKDRSWTNAEARVVIANTPFQEGTFQSSCQDVCRLPLAIGTYLYSFLGRLCSALVVPLDTNHS